MKRVELASFGLYCAYKVVSLIFMSFCQENEESSSFDRKESYGGEFQGKEEV